MKQFRNTKAQAGVSVSMGERPNQRHVSSVSETSYMQTDNDWICLDYLSSQRAVSSEVS